MRDRAYLKIYKKHFGEIPKDHQGRSYHIHHIDGNPNNNDPSNLKALSAQDHFDTHFRQGDWLACLLLSSDISLSLDEKTALAKQAAKISVENGTHPWLGGDVQRKTQRRLVEEGNHHWQDSKKATERNQKRVENGTHNFLDKTAARNRNIKRVAEGRHHFLKPGFQSETQNRLVAEGRHPFVGGGATKRQLLEGKHPSQKLLECLHCGKTVSSGMFARWHGDKCKQKVLRST